MGGTLTLGALDLLADPFHAQLRTSFGAWQPITTSTDSLFLDGSVVSGDSTGNREVLLVVAVEAVSRAVLGQACEALVSELNAASNLLIWTPDGGIAQVYETYRAGVLARRDDEDPDNLRRVYEVSIPARPFVRSLARQQAVASAAAGVVVDDMEASAPGVVMGRQVRQPGSTGLLADWGPTADPSVAALLALQGATVQGGVLAATGATVTDTTTSVGGLSKQVARLTAAGTSVLVRSAAVAVTSDYVSCIWGVHPNAGSVTYYSGVEWLDASNTVLRTDWGSAMVVASSESDRPYAVWQASPRPSGATKVRAVLRYASSSGAVSDVHEVTVMPSARVTVTPTGIAHDGGASLGLVAENREASGGGGLRGWMTSGYVHRVLPAPVDVSAQTRWRMWVQYLGVQYARVRGMVQVPTLRLWDSAGNWSRWSMTTLPVPDKTWMQMAADLASPVESSVTPCNLTAVVAWDVSVDMDLDDIVDGSTESSMTVWLDTFTAGPAATGTTSTRGTVLTLGPIQGSARTTAAVTLSSPTAMPSALVACIDGTVGEPLLSITSNAATASAGYDGVYSVLAALLLNVAVTNPTLTITQKIGGTTVATQVLTGTQPAGSWWVDFGVISLPLVDVPDENASVTYGFALSTTGTPPWMDMLLIDVDASMVWLPYLSTSRKVVSVDEPDPTSGLGRVWVGDNLDRTDGRAPMTPAVVSRPLHVTGPSTRVLGYVPGSGIITLSVMVTYWPRWGAEALV